MDKKVNKRSHSVYYPPTFDFEKSHEMKRQSEILPRVDDDVKNYIFRVSQSKKTLLEQEDIDHDKRITIDEDGPKVFKVEADFSGELRSEKLAGVYNLSVLLQELDFAEQTNINNLLLPKNLIAETPIDRLRRLIQWWFWPALVRHIDASTLDKALEDEKLQYNVEYYKKNKLLILEEAKSVGGTYFIENFEQLIHNQIIYVPEQDPLNIEYYEEISRTRKCTEKQISVVRLSTDLKPPFIHFLRHFPGLLALCLTQKTKSRYKESNYPSLFKREEIDPTKSIIDTYVSTPFIVPGGRFNEMYGWDSYFILRGLLLSQEVPTSYTDPRNADKNASDLYPEHHLKHFMAVNSKIFPIALLCKGIVDNFAYQIVNYGKIHNANRSYYLTRSQPPFLTDMIISVYSLLKKKIDTYADEEVKEEEYKSLMAWLTHLTEVAMYEYKHVWMSKPRYDESTGLSTYRSDGMRIPPETEPTHFDHSIRPFADDAGIDLDEYKVMYQYGRIQNEKLDDYFSHDRAVRESGHDTSYRLENIAADLCTVDLASLLYKFETDISIILDTHYEGGATFNGTSLTSKYAADGIYMSEYWKKAALKRRELVNKYCWNEEKGMFFDYNFVKKEQHQYESLTTFWPLWVDMATTSQAEKLAGNLYLFEQEGGLSASTERSRGPLSSSRPPKQWDYPYGWAPQQIITWEGLVKYGYIEDAQRLIYRWCYMLTNSFKNYNGVISEKYDVVQNTFKVFAEYGNVGAEFEYSPKEGFGWTNSSILIGYSLLTLLQKRSLMNLIPVESVFQNYMKTVLTTP